MYQFSYAEIAEDSFATARIREREAMARCIEAMRTAEAAGPRSREAVEALYLVRSLWTLLVEDLGNAENQLPEDLRARLISIGLWILREAEGIRQGRVQSFTALIDVMDSVREGLES